MTPDIRSTRTLVLVSPERANAERDNTVLISQKTLEGGIEYAKRWPGKVKMLFEQSSPPQISGSLRKVALSDLPFEIIIAPYNSGEFRAHLNSADLRLITLSSHLVQLASETGCIGARCVFVAENSLRTRWQMIKATTRNPAIRIRRFLWEAQQERRFRAALRVSGGVQCNGTPTYRCYRQLNANALLFFDGRVASRDLVEMTDVIDKLEGHKTKPLHLAFSGRLISIKGVEDLLVAARALKQAGADFVLSICGEGPLESKLRQMAASWQLDRNVVFRGYLDFANELLPFMKQEVDLFLCCHRQGDPSCTYLETMACGVPILGYANEAFEGVWRVSRGGWLCPMGNPKGVARKVMELMKNREEIAERARDALTFANQHSVEMTFDRRVHQLVRILETAELGSF